MTTPASARPTARYGNDNDSAKPSGIGGKIIVIVVVLALLVGGFFLVRNVQNRSAIPVEVAMVTYERQDDDMMRVWVDITREDVDVPSYCIVTSLNYAMAEVGRREVIMPPGGDAATRVAVDIPSRDYPVSGDVYGCATDIPPHMDIDNPTYTF